jgi:hypothetical protein
MNSRNAKQINLRTVIGLIGLLLFMPGLAKASLYQIDDGVSEDSVGLFGSPNDFIALNQFNVINGQDMIGSVEIAWGTPHFPDPSLNGLSYTAAIWADPNADGDPSDAFLLATAPGVISSANTDTFNITTFSNCVQVTTSFFVGFLIGTDGSKYVAGFDQSNPLLGRSYVAGNGFGQGDLGNLNNNTLLPLGTVEGYGLNGNFMIRADPWTAVPEPSTLAFLAIGGISVLVSAIRQSRGRVA